ncbi:hypothetical protein SAMN05421812_12574, partial [Asanoa hainanensis]
MTAFGFVLDTSSILGYAQLRIGVAEMLLSAEELGQVFGATELCLGSAADLEAAGIGTALGAHAVRDHGSLVVLADAILPSDRRVALHRLFPTRADVVSALLASFHWGVPVV